MKRRSKFPVYILYIAAMMVLILDSKTAINGARDGIMLCVQSVIPSLFPFIFLCGLITSSFSASKISLFKPINRLCRISQGAEVLLALGFLGGYPVGAQNICNAYQGGVLQKDTAKRMLIFCNNAGPAFIFGIVATQFADSYMGWYLWGIIILSAIMTAVILPGGSDEVVESLLHRHQNVSLTLTNAVKAMGSICGWVVIFRLILFCMDGWNLFALPAEVRVLISGLMELTNGCMRLQEIACESDRFIVSAVLLSFGGMCVLMQTATVAKGIGLKGYLPGKMLQSSLSYLLCLLVQPILFSQPVSGKYLLWGVLLLVISVISVYYLRDRKECSSILRRNIVYCQHESTQM